jgi:8-oxo-dGTP diphosphatase
MTPDLNAIRRPYLRVSVGMLINEQNQFLLTSRPEGKAYAGYWEFPGGKIEVGETAYDALKRELLEEIGIIVTQARPWLVQHFDYPHAHVELSWFQITDWQNEIQPQENQAFSWQTLNHLTVKPILPACSIIFHWLSLPNIMTLSNVANIGESAFLAQLQQHPTPSYLILREPQLNTQQFAQLAEKVMAIMADKTVIFHTHIELAKQLGASGVHMSSLDLMRCENKPENLQWVGASIHSAIQLEKANSLGLDYAFLGPVLPTSSHAHQSTLGWSDFQAQLQHQNRMPIFAIGELTPDDLAMAQTYGAHGIALLSRAGV